ncbi:MAG: DUF1361 domain-containing protein [Tissierellia bacterium]|nr:DUF1361 domain-containing protein [Tissierellia bacterium]
MKRKNHMRGYFFYPLFFFIISFGILFLNIPRQYLIWNLILAFVPYLLTEMALSVHHKGIKILCTFLGFLFFPNAIYLFTDFIHYNSSAFYRNTSSGIEYIMEIKLWVSYCLTYFSVLLGAVLSYECTRNFWYLFSLRKRVFRVLLTVILSLPVGLAIYWGRFVRLNSWNLFSNPKNLWVSFWSLGEKEYLWIFLFAFTYLFATALFTLISKKE